MPSNSTARYRAQVRAAATGQIPSDLPDYLRNQYTFQGGGSESGQPDRQEGPGTRMRDAKGNEVVLLNDDGSLENSQDLDINSGGLTNVHWDPDLGLVADASSVNEDRWKAGQRRRALTAAAIIAAGAGAGASGLLGGAGEVGAATIPESALGTLPLDTAVGSSPALAELPSIISAGDAGLGVGAAATGSGGLAALGSSGAATIPESALGTLPMDTATAGSPALASLPSIQQAGAGPGIVDALGGPGNLARAGLGLAALGSSASHNNGSGNSSSNANDIINQMAQANRVDQNTPLGTRRWAQGPDGRWTVTDAMDPNEQANFTNVQGMNADVTGMARQRLAGLLANPLPKQRYDRPLGT
jgi:hypothetical protein